MNDETAAVLMPLFRRAAGPVDNYYDDHSRQADRDAFMKEAAKYGKPEHILAACYARSRGA